MKIVSSHIFQTSRHLASHICFISLVCIGILSSSFMGEHLPFTPLALRSSEAFANPSDEQLERSQDLILRARKSAAKGEYQEGIRLFEEANDLISSPDNLFAIASIYERIEGECERAISSWSRFLRACQSCSLLQRGQKRAELLETQCKVKLTIDSRPVGARVTLNGEERGITPITLDMFAGKHRLSLALQEYHPVQQSIFLLKGSKSDVKSITLSPLTAARTPLQEPGKPNLNKPISTPSSAGATAAQTTLTPPPPAVEREIEAMDWVLIGSGVVLTTLGALSYLSARSEIDQINSAKSVQSLNSAQRDSSYQLKEGIGYVGMGLGLGLSAYGVFRVSF